MSRPKRISVFFRKILSMDPSAGLEYAGRRCSVLFKSAMAKDDICDVYGDFIVDQWSFYDSRGAAIFRVVFDCSTMKVEEDPVVPGFSFDRMLRKQSARSVLSQENEGARIIDGRRHVGSGAIAGLKSDASGPFWQQESKQTKASSVGLKLAWLDKITREARSQDKHPMLFIRFLDIPDGLVVEDDWVVVPKSVFEKMSVSSGV